MDIASFKDSPIGHLVPISGLDPRLNREFNHWAFVPKALPEDLSLRSETHSLVAMASREIGRLQSAFEQLPRPEILLQTSLKREAQSTSALEGTYAPLESIFEGEFLPEAETPSDVREILNYIKAANLGIERVKEKPIHINLLSELQGLIVDKTPGGQSSKGQVRTTPVIIGDHNEPVEKARFVPPPAGEILNAGYSDWEKWINREHSFSHLIVIALSHYQFEALHPYNDGNGRLGRLVISLQFATLDLLTPPILNLSAWFNDHKIEYKNQLLHLSQTGDFDAWVAFFARAVIEQVKLEIQRIKALLGFRDEMFTQIKSSGARGMITEMPETILATPYFTVQRIADKHQVSYPAASSVISKLVDLGFLREITGKSYGKLFICNEVLNILNS